MVTFTARVKADFDNLFGVSTINTFDKTRGADRIHGTADFVYQIGDVRLFFQGSNIVYDQPSGKRMPVGGTIDLIVVQQRGPLVNGARVYIDQYEFSNLT